MNNQRPTIEQIYEMIEDNQMPYCGVCGRNLNSFDTHARCQGRTPVVDYRLVRRGREEELIQLLNEAAQ